MCAQLLSHVWLSATPRTVACQASLSMEFSRQEYWSGLPFSSPGDLLDPEIEPASLASSALAGGFFTAVPPGDPPWVLHLVPPNFISLHEKILCFDWKLCKTLMSSNTLLCSFTIGNTLEKERIWGLNEYRITKLSYRYSSWYSLFALLLQLFVYIYHTHGFACPRTHTLIRHYLPKSPSSLFKKFDIIQGCRILLVNFYHDFIV